MERIFIVTGGSGFLGGHIVRKLSKQGNKIRALLLEGENLNANISSDLIEIVYGDITDRESLVPLFEGLEEKEVVVIHSAGIVDIESTVSPLTYKVNVVGTRNMVDLSLEVNVHRFLYISSVHALPEPEIRSTIVETKDFSPEDVVGGYAKTKAEASAYVMKAYREGGLNSMIFMPSGLVGPGYVGQNSFADAIKWLLKGRYKLCPDGGYDFVDVRDVAKAVVDSVDKGSPGETYILSGGHYELSDIFKIISKLTKRNRKCIVIPNTIVRLIAPVIEKTYKIMGKKPFVTEYSARTINVNDNFSHEKASRELGFWPRDIVKTLRDALIFMKKKERPNQI
ncbi:MAG: NAD-dependent epimerase/dehydratase family protein [Ruminococcaceae bacterium]|nr:NAD-dependent epimerase/dehydratase family protein [Oscillospiraceae bacterium]